MRKRMTIALIVGSNNSTWRSRLLCEYHLWLICVSVWYILWYLFLFYILNQFLIESPALPMILKVHYVCCVEEINLCVALIQSSL